MAAQFPPRSFFSVASAPGNGTITAGTALPAYQLPKNATPPYTSGAKIPYVAIDGSNFEGGWGIYTNNNGTETITRNLRYSSTGALLNLSASAQIMITPSMQDQITFGNASNGDGLEHTLKVGWALGADNVYRLTFDLDNAATVGSLATYADLLVQLARITALEARATGAERELAVLQLLRSVSAVAISAVGFLDDYADLSGVDQANSTGLGLTQYSAITAMTAAAAPAPEAAFSDGEYAGGDSATGINGWMAFDKATNTTWTGGHAPSSAANASYVGIDLGSAKTVTSAIVTAAPSTGFANSRPVNFHVAGSNNSSTGPWTTVASKTDGAAMAFGASISLSIPGGATYRYWALFVDSVVASNTVPQIAEFDLQYSGPAGDISNMSGSTTTSNTTYAAETTSSCAYGSNSAAPSDSAIFSNQNYSGGNLYSPYSLWDNVVNSNDGWTSTANPPSFPCINARIFNNGAFALASYSLNACSDAATRMCTAWQVQGSNDTTNGTDGTWTTLDTRSGISWTSSSTQNFKVNSTVAYKAYRLYVTAIGSTSDYMRIGEMFLFKNIATTTSTTTAQPAAMSLRSVRATLKYTPSRVYYYGTAKMAGGVLNTDLKASVTRDGATYTQGTLVPLFTKADGSSIYELQDGSGKPGVDVTGQPSGQAVGYKIDATAAYRQDLYNADLRAAA